MVMVKGKELTFFLLCGFLLSHTEKYFAKHLNVFPVIQSSNGLVVLNKEDTSIGSLGFVCVGAKNPGLTIWVYEPRELVSLARFAILSEALFWKAV